MLAEISPETLVATALLIVCPLMWGLAMSYVGGMLEKRRRNRSSK